MTKWFIIIILGLLTLLVVTCGREVHLKNKLEKSEQDKNDYKKLYNAQNDSGTIWKTEAKEWRNKAHVLEIEARNKKEVKEVIRYIEKFPEIKNNGKNLESIHNLGVETDLPVWEWFPDPEINVKPDSLKIRTFIIDTSKTPCKNILVEHGQLVSRDTFFIAGYEGKRTKKFLFVRYGPKSRWVDINSGPCFKIFYNKKIEFKKK